MDRIINMFFVFFDLIFSSKIFVKKLCLRIIFISIKYAGFNDWPVFKIMGEWKKNQGCYKIYFWINIWIDWMLAEHFLFHGSSTHVNIQIIANCWLIHDLTWVSSSWGLTLYGTGRWDIKIHEWTILVQVYCCPFSSL